MKRWIISSYRKDSSRDMSSATGYQNVYINTKYNNYIQKRKE